MDIFVEQNIHILVQKSSLKFEIQMNIQVPSPLSTMYAAQDRQAGSKNVRKDWASTKYNFDFQVKMFLIIVWIICILQIPLCLYAYLEQDLWSIAL